MLSLQKNLKWLLPILALGLLLSIVLVFYGVAQAQNGTRIPPCEAMRPYIQYHGIEYLAKGNDLVFSDLDRVVTTVGDEPAQAKSCMPLGTSIYSVKGYPFTSYLAANFGNLMLFEAVPPTLSHSSIPPLHPTAPKANNNAQS